MPSRFRHLGSIAILGILIGLPARALTAESADSGWLYTAWQTDEGLPNNTVVGIVQTPDGFLWLGTPTGLSRFDGVQFQVFPPTNLVAPPDRGVLKMIGTKGGGLCLAMDRAALVVLEGGKAKVFMPGQDVPDESPYQLMEDHEGAVWAAYRAGSVCRIDGSKVTLFSERDGLPAAGMCAMACDTRGRIWYAKDGAFGEFVEGRFQSQRRFGGAITLLAPAKDGSLWIGSGNVLYAQNARGDIEEHGAFGASSQGSGPTAMLEDRTGAVWIGTPFNGLIRFDGERFEEIPTKHREILALAEDHEGNIWAGTGGGGLNRIRPRVVVLEGTASGLPLETVQSLCEDTQGTIWAATQSGRLARRIHGRWHEFKPEPGWNGKATCLAADPSGAIWIGTELNGLYLWKHDRLIPWGATNNPIGNTIHTLHVSKAGELWIGEDNPNAVRRINDGALTTFQAPPGEDLRVVRAMTEDASGSVWIGTSRGLLLRPDGNRLVDVSHYASTLPISIRCLNSTPDGSVWVGYAGWGVGRFKDGKLAVMGTAQGLFDDFVSQIVADQYGWMWFGSDRGIFKVRQAELDGLAEGKITRVRSIHYGKGEALPSLQAVFGVAPGAIRSRDGRLWIPMRTGLAVVRPDRLVEQPGPPPVLLNRFAVDDRTIASYLGALPNTTLNKGATLDIPRPQRAISIPPGHRRTLFEFTAPSFIAPENLHFKYRLEPLDDGWTEAETGRSASYSRLPAGDYTFSVIACNSEGVWNERGASVSFMVLPFFWHTWWFRASALAAFTLTVVGVVRYVSFRRLRVQMRQLEQQAALHKERARIAKDIHDDLGASLTQIALLGELARQDRASPDLADQHVGKISDTARQVIKSLDEIVWAVNPGNDTLAHLVDYAGQFAVDYLRVAGIRCRLDLPDHIPEREVSTDIRHNLFLLVKESINNVVKHARASEVWLRVQATESHLDIRVEDDGCGFEEMGGTRGADGLGNIRQRIADLGGDCSIVSRPGAGTVVQVRLPWPD